MGDLLTAPAEAYAPDPDRADLDSPTLMPEWLAYVIALVILSIIETIQALPQRPARRPASRPINRPAQARDSAHTPAFSINSRSGHATARTRRGQAIPVNGQDLSHARAALLDKLRQANVGPAVWSQLEALGIVPAPTDPGAAATLAPSPRRTAKLRRAPRRFLPAVAPHAVLPALRRPMLARAGTGPPTGPPAVSGYQSCYA
jgi:hypothetical protein